MNIYGVIGMKGIKKKHSKDQIVNQKNLYRSYSMKQAKIICITCSGTGETIDEESGDTYVCETCGGTGRIEDDSDFTGEK